uniref:Methyltransferase FkbM domain-containing protein n=1 Tax=Craspedostauros australis TaxID=1486917 RepID=A0A6T6E3V1_9STRA|mmetsp:Transcript_14796/g.40951  ORF Transcript_14796/g.40951 Transcript_14796/m.40951 type:complete len:382 (+) Transcript_14796:135-1280(+)
MAKLRKGHKTAARRKKRDNDNADAASPVDADDAHPSSPRNSRLLQLRDFLRFALLGICLGTVVRQVFSVVEKSGAPTTVKPHEVGQVSQAGRAKHFMFGTFGHVRRKKKEREAGAEQADGAATNLVTTAAPPGPFQPYDCTPAINSVQVPFSRITIDLPYTTKLDFDFAADYPRPSHDINMYGTHHASSIGAMDSILQAAKGKSTYVFVDVGSDMGWYSACAAHFGIQSYSFDLSDHSNNLFCRTIDFNKERWQANVPVIYSHIIDGADHSLDAFATHQGWMPEGPDILLQVDTDGNDKEIWDGAKQLVQSQRVKHIFWNMMPKMEATVQMLVDNGYQLHAQGRDRGLDVIFNTPLDAVVYGSQVRTPRLTWWVHSSAQPL